MKKIFILRLTRLFTVIAAVVGIGLHQGNKLVDGVSGATRQKNHTRTSNDNSTTSDDSSTSSDDSTITNYNTNPISTNYNNNPIITTGWVKEGTNWLYIRKDASKAIGWINDGGKWYYLANDGLMQTGWIKDSSGSWYYLDTSGVMLANTKIGGYTLGSDGRML